MIYTITLNPALDLEFTIRSIQYDQVLRAEQVRADCGGKGFNIARALTEWGVPSVALGLVGGKTGERLHDELGKLGVRTDFSWIGGETRINIAIITSPAGKYIKVNQPGPEVTAREIGELLEKVRALASPDGLWAITGSLPPGVEPQIYAEIIQVVQSAGGKALLDADGDTLVQACQAKPFLVKPNALEASQVSGVELLSLRDVREAARFFHQMGVELVLITMGEQGAALSDGVNVWWAAPPSVNISSPIGAGDAALAGFIWGLSQGERLERALKLAVASGTASASLPGTAIAGREPVLKIAGEVRWGQF